MAHVKECSGQAFYHQCLLFIAFVLDGNYHHLRVKKCNKNFTIVIKPHTSIGFLPGEVINYSPKCILMRLSHLFKMNNPN